jgi:CBS domain-containing protein
MRAKDIMTRNPITTMPQTTIEELCETLRRENINGTPVVDETGKLVGVVSQDDVIFRKAGRNEDVQPPRDIKDLFQRGFAPIAESDAAPRRVGEIMTREVISADEDTTVEQLCRTMWERRIHRVPITRDGKLIGIVSALDLCKIIASGRVNLPE